MEYAEDTIAWLHGPFKTGLEGTLNAHEGRIRDMERTIFRLRWVVFAEACIILITLLGLLARI